MMIVSRKRQPANGLMPMEVTLSGMAASFRTVLANAQSPMEVTLLAMVISLRPLQR